MSKPNFLTSRKERLGYYGYFIGQNIIYIFVTLFLSVYYTTALGISPAVVGTILLIARVWDAVNDPMLSILIEKANLKGGKFKPWIKSVAFLIPILTVVIFSFTDLLTALSLGARIAYATITYIIWGMTYTISDAPAYALATVMTTETRERNSLISFSRIGALIGILIAMVVGPTLVDTLGGNWFLTAVILSVIGFIFLLMINTTKERVKSVNQSPTLKQILGAIFQNQYLVIIVLTLIFLNGFNFGMTITPFLAADVFGDPGLASIMLGLTMLPMVIAAPLLPRFAEKFGKNKIMITSLAVVPFFSVITYFVGYESFPIYMVLSILKTVLSSFSLIIGTLYFADCIEYDFYRKGTRFEAAVFSAQTFTNKAMGAISGAGAMWLLAFFGYKESLAGETIVQTQAAIDGIWMTSTLGPGVGAAIALIIFLKFYDMDENKLQKMGEDSGCLNPAPQD